LASRHRAWFEAFAPADDPKISVVAMLAAGAWGAEASGPIVRTIMEAWLATQGGAPARPLPPAASSAPTQPEVPEDVPVPADGGATP
uniref:penicillin-binding transpeptidase domain-containing protein n=1 Tax=Frateuria sp. YIM B11624 TaxID=3143185 RepID=UPI003C746E8F